MSSEANRVYKDNVFRLLFGEESKSAELYNAIKGTSYAPGALSMNTLQNALYYGGLRNDVSFTIEDKLVILLEHQSTVSPNMGLRCLLYIADIYKHLIRANKDDLYKTVPMSIETPEFYVLYNGQDEYPDRGIVKLSDLFRVQGAENSLELIVTVYNVNHGRNAELMKRSRTLTEYAAFVAKVKGYKEKSLTDTKALDKAIEDCLNANILREFLLKYGGEIVSILNMEWNLDDALRVRGEEEREKKAVEMATKMLLKNKPTDEIIEFTELTEEKILQLKKKLEI